MQEGLIEQCREIASSEQAGGGRATVFLGPLRAHSAFEARSDMNLEAAFWMYRLSLKVGENFDLGRDCLSPDRWRKLPKLLINRGVKTVFSDQKPARAKCRNPDISLC